MQMPKRHIFVNSCNERELNIEWFPIFWYRWKLYMRTYLYRRQPFNLFFLPTFSINIFLHWQKHGHFIRFIMPAPYTSSDWRHIWATCDLLIASTNIISDPQFLDLFFVFCVFFIINDHFFFLVSSKQKPVAKLWISYKEKLGDMINNAYMGPFHCSHPPTSNCLASCIRI